MYEILLASANKGKIKEIDRLFQEFGLEIRIKTLGDYNLTSAKENGSSFRENAMIKALEAYEATGLTVLAEDSGLVVESLSGAPGIYSARYAGEFSTNQDNIRLLLNNMQSKENRQAYFVAVMVLLTPNKDSYSVEIVKGKLCGIIREEAVGHHGFGYDPIFEPTIDNVSLGRTLAELSVEEKNKLSHRRQALVQIAEILKKRS